MGDNDGARKRYYAERHGYQPERLDLDEAKQLFASVVSEAAVDDRLQMWFGFSCVDAGDVPGKAGTDVVGYVYRKTRRRDLWPIAEHLGEWDEGALLTAVEFMHDHVAEATDGQTHGYMNCGFHASDFDVEAGQRRYRDDVNLILGDYGSGFELGVDGQIVRSAPDEMTELLDSPVDARSDDDVRSRVDDAIRKFRSRVGRLEDRRDAVRDLVDLVELLQDRVANTLESADERDLFHLANKFGIRHANAAQKTNYDLDVWLDWMFYHYLASIRAYTRLIARKTAKERGRAVIQYREGQRLTHPRYGVGIVVASRLTEGDEVVTVAFRDPQVGRKQLTASLARFETLS